MAPPETLGPLAALWELVVGIVGALIGGGAVYGRMTTRIANLEKENREFKGRFESLEEDASHSSRSLAEAIERMRQELRADLREVRDDLKGDVRELRGRIDNIATKVD